MRWTTIRQQSWTPALASVVVLTALWALFFWRLWTPTPADRVIFRQDSDFALHLYAPIRYQIERFLQGELALWNPYSRAGMPHIGDIQNATFYPPRYLLAALLARDGQWPIEAYQWEVAAHLWLTSLLMFACARALVGRAVPALIAALLWAYSGFMTGYPILQPSILMTVTWLPLAVLGLHWAVTGTGARWRQGVALAALALALMLLAGHPQMVLYCGYLLLAYSLYTGLTQGHGLLLTLAHGALALALGLALAGIQLLPALEFTRLSARLDLYAYPDKAHGFDLAALTGLLWPASGGHWSPLYIGDAGLLLAVAGLFSGRRAWVFWLTALVVAGLVAFGNSTAAYDLLYVFAPGFSLFRNPERAAGIMAFALALLAGYGLDALLRSGRARARLLPVALLWAGALTLFFLSAGVLLAVGLVSTAEALDALGLSALVAVVFTLWLFYADQAELSRAGLLALLIALIVFDLFAVGQRSANYQPDRPEHRLTLDAALADLPAPPEAITGRVDGAAGLQGSSMFFRVPDIYGVGPLALASVEGLYTLPVDRLWEALAVHTVTTSDQPPDSVPLDLLAYGVNRAGEPYQRFALRDPRPLAHLVYDYREALGSPVFARQIMADARVNLREMAVTLAPLPFALPGQRPDISSVDDLRILRPEHITLTASTSADALLTLAIVHYPGWRASVNGQPVDSVDVYAGLIGVPLRAGISQQVALTFAPESLRLGALLTGLGLIVWLLLSFSALLLHSIRFSR